jgi:hypothetical protein
VFRCLDQRRPNQVQDNIPRQLEQIGVAVDQDALESSLKQVTGAAMAPIRCLRVDTIEMAHATPQAFVQPAKVSVAILVIEEAGPAIVATLHDVQRYAVDVDARTPGHGGGLAEIEPGPCFPRQHGDQRCPTLAWSTSALEKRDATV